MTNLYLPTLLDLAIMSGNDQLVGLIDETTKQIPEISGLTEDGQRIPNVANARPMKGLFYKTLVRVELPTVTFRNANQGSSRGKARYEERVVQAFILNPRWECDQAVADDHDPGGAPAFISLEAGAITEAAFQTLGRQFFYGQSGANAADAKGHPGLMNSVHADYRVNAGGTGTDCSTIWAVKFGPQHVQWVYGNGGSLTMGQPRLETIYDDDGDALDGYVQSMLARPGLQVGSTRSVGCVANIDDAHPATDDMVFTLLSKMKVRPDVLFMHREVREHIRTSRTATNATGSPAPTPMEIGNIPVAVTESIVRTETEQTF